MATSSDGTPMAVSSCPMHISIATTSVWPLLKKMKFTINFRFIPFKNDFWIFVPTSILYLTAMNMSSPSISAYCPFIGRHNHKRLSINDIHHLSTRWNDIFVSYPIRTHLQSFLLYVNTHHQVGMKPTAEYDPPLAFHLLVPLKLFSTVWKLPRY